MKKEKTSRTPHEDRVVVEANELRVKHEALYSFIHDSDIFKKLSIYEQQLLKKQEKIMQEYFDILVLRINNF